MANIIEVTGLGKAYGSIQAVDDISFHVEGGTLFAFLGPNGAGKSTTIDMLCTLLKPDSGSVIMDGRLLGEENDAIRAMLGVVFQNGVLDDLLTVEENLAVRGSLYGIKGDAMRKSIALAAHETGVEDLLKRPCGKLSGGQRRRCDIARALIHTPKILFLDEPTTGLDPQTRRNVWETVHRLQRQTGMTVFLTTHYMEEAAQADYVVVIDNGKIAAKGTPAHLKQQYASDMLKLYALDMEKLYGRLNELGKTYVKGQDHAIVKVTTTLDALPLLDACRDLLSGFEVANGTMDDAFIGITGKEIRP